MLNPKIYSEKYFLSKRCEGLNEYLVGELSGIKKLEIKLLRLNKKDVILDLGCGRGDICSYLKKYKYNFKTIDYSKAAIKMTRKRLGKKYWKRILLRDARKTGFKNDFFDKILIGDVIEHMNFNDGITVINECYRILKKNGTLVLHTSPNLYFKRYVYPLVYTFLFFYKPKISQELKSNINATYKYHVQEYSLPLLRRLFKVSNFNKYHLWIKDDVIRTKTKSYLDDLKKDTFTKTISRFINKSPLIHLFGNDLFAVAKK